MIEDLKQHSKMWILIALLIFVFNFLGLIYVNHVLNNIFDYESISGFLLLALMIAILLGITGYLGAKIFFRISLVFNGLALLYMIYISINQPFANWDDIISMIYFLLILGVGVIIGAISQLWYNFKKKLN